jgi:chaperone required for assembly of F1-ATPase
MVTELLRRRFWAEAAVRPESSDFAVFLDTRPLRTPGKAPLRVPVRALADGVAGEWNAVEGEIRPETMPLTRAVNVTIDRVAPDPAPLVAGLSEYGGTDLICYRAEAPEGLRARQSAAWDPLLDWSARALRAPLVAVVGVMHHPQPEASLATLRAEVARFDPFRLTALSELIALSGSLVIGLAVARGVLDASEAWEISRIDETWQAEQWGLDIEAEAAAARRRADFLQAEALLRLLGPEAAAR